MSLIEQTKEEKEYATHRKHSETMKRLHREGFYTHSKIMKGYMKRRYFPFKHNPNFVIDISL